MREPERPDPDSLLRQLHEEERRSGRGKLKIFFGYVAGVGKTYAMLEAAQRQAAAGVDLVVGYVETHDRPETNALLEGLEDLPVLEIDHRSITLRELNLDAALARHPEIVLVDELAHTNAPGLRHPKRWQDVEELLTAGISVYATLNVQHLESLNDVVRETTGIQVRETVPDSIFDEADSVEIVDLPPGELRERLRQGKVYLPAQAAQAMEGFFKGPNLGALREIALRRTADRTHVHLETARLTAGDRQQTWRISETLLVCIGPSPTSAKVIRVSKRMAASISARWIAASVETNRTRSLGEAQRITLMANIRLAEQLGAETVALTGDDAAGEILDYARSQNVTRIVIGKSRELRWRSIIRPTIVDQLLRRSGEMDIYVIQGLAEVAASPRPLARPSPAWRPYAAALGLVFLAGVVALLLHLGGLSEANKAVVFLPAVVLAAVWWGLWPGILAAVASVLAFDFFFVPPYYTFAVRDVQYLLTLVVFLAVALLVGTLAARLRRQVRTSRARERRLDVLYRLSRALSGVSGSHQLAVAAQREVATIFGGAVNVYLPHGSLLEPVVSGDEKAGTEHEIAVATWSFEHGQMAGNGTDTLPDAIATYVPLSTPQATVGVLAVNPPRSRFLLSPENRQLLETVAGLIGIAIERDQLAEQHRYALVEAETERTRSSLLSSVSHDLRTPLAVIAGTTSTLLEMGDAADTATRNALLSDIYDEANRLTRLVENLLSMTRLESGAIVVDKEWFPLDDVVGSTLVRLRDETAGREITKRIPGDLPLVPLDGVLIEQVLFNLIDNALKYSPAGSPLEISAHVDDRNVAVEVADRGPGLTEAERDQVFEKLYRGTASKHGGRGAGLGLPIAQAIVEAHRGNDLGPQPAGWRGRLRVQPPAGRVSALSPPRRRRGNGMNPAEPIVGSPGAAPSSLAARILVIEDDTPMRHFLRTALSSRGYRVTEADTGQTGLDAILALPPDLILLDLGLPDMDGMTLLENVREWSQVPVIILSARGQEAAKVAALDSGADDYVTKPFGIPELLARIAVSLRHASALREAGSEETARFQTGDISVDLARRTVTVKGHVVHLTPIEYRLLAVFVRHAGKVLTHGFLLREVWGLSSSAQSHYLRIYVASLRKKLEDDPADPRYLVTEQGVGYRLNEV